MKKIAVILLALALGSCHPKTIQSLEKTTEATKDSVNIQTSVSVRDTCLKIKGDSSQILTDVKADSAGRINLIQTIIETPREKTVVSISNGKLKATCVCKDLEQKVTLYEKQIREYSAHKCAEQKEKITTVIKPERYIPGWVKVLAWIGAISIVLIVLYIIVKLKIKPL